MMETKAFPTCDVVGAITGRLMGSMDGVYQVLAWMAGEPIWTHQLPRVIGEAWVSAIAAIPALAVLKDEHPQVNAENAQAWRDCWLDRYGPVIAVPRMTPDQHERIEPQSELVEKIHPDRIFPV